MRTAKYLTGAALLIISLAACGSTPAFNGSRTGNDEQFLLDYSMFNTTDSQELTAQAGDQIRADITVDGGELTVQIQKEGEEPLYSGDGIVASCDFAIGIEESGTYTITVSPDAPHNASQDYAAYVMKDLDFDDDSIIDSKPLLRGSTQTVTAEDGEWLELFGTIATPTE